jgi:hypothetical protein
MPSNYYEQAIGSYEAAALMGLHFGQPQKLIARGVLTARTVTQSAYSDAPLRFVSIYDGAECEANFQDYDANGPTKRARLSLHLRPEAVRRLKAVKTPITFDDAITLAEAAEILGVHISLLPRLVESGKIVGRRPWNPRGLRMGARNWIVSRRSCLERARIAKAQESAGTKRGRPRVKNQ